MKTLPTTTRGEPLLPTIRESLCTALKTQSLVSERLSETRLKDCSSFEGHCAPLWSALPGKAIKLLFCTSPQTLCTRFNSALVPRSWAFSTNPSISSFPFSPTTLSQTWENFLSSFADLLLSSSPGTFIYWSILNIAQNSSKVGRLNLLKLCRLHPLLCPGKGPHPVNLLKNLVLRIITSQFTHKKGFSGDSDGKESVCGAGDLDWSLGGEDLLEKGWQPIPYLKNPMDRGALPGESHGQRSLASYGPWGLRESDRTDGLSLPLYLQKMMKGGAKSSISTQRTNCKGVCVGRRREGRELEGQ